MAEYYDYEAEARRRSSLAESSLSEQLIGLARRVEDVVLMLPDLIKYLGEGDTYSIISLYHRIRGEKERVESFKDEALSYLARLGTLLNTVNIYKDSFISLSRIATNIDGIAYRAMIMLENGLLRLPPKIITNLSEIVKVFVDQYRSLSYSIQMLLEDPRKSYEAATKVFSLEEEIDQRYRQTNIDLYKVLKDEVVALLLLRDLTELLEDTADIVRDIAENVRFLSLYRTAASPTA